MSTQPPEDVPGIASLDFATLAAAAASLLPYKFSNLEHPSPLLFSLSHPRPKPSCIHLIYKNHHHIESDNTTMPIPNFQSQSSNETTTINNPPSTTTTTEEIQTGARAGAGANTGAGVTREKTAAELEADRLYEEAMEEEYAKREGGA